MAAPPTRIVFALVVLIAIPVSGAAANPPDYVELVKSRLVIVKITAGTFRMGSGQEIGADDDWKICPACPPRNDVERPVHQVTISKDFWTAQFVVTQRQWQEVMGNNPSRLRSAGLEAPVEQVTWKDVQSFLAKVNAMQVRWMVRLPTEAEWEYAARAGSPGETYGPLDDIAWYRGNGLGATHPVGQKLPNAFGLYDMLGNVWRWCQDWFGPTPASPRSIRKDRRQARDGLLAEDVTTATPSTNGRREEIAIWRNILRRVSASGLRRSLGKRTTGSSRLLWY